AAAARHAWPGGAAPRTPWTTRPWCLRDTREPGRTRPRSSRTRRGTSASRRRKREQHSPPSASRGRAHADATGGRRPPAGRGELFCDAEPGAAGAGVALRLRGSRHDRASGDGTQTRAVPADAGGEVGRTDAVPRLARDERLHGAVLEGVERDDQEASAG